MVKHIQTFDTHTKIHFEPWGDFSPTGKKAKSGQPIWRMTDSWSVWWFHNHTRYEMRLPRGFETDFSSTPKWIWWWLPPFDPEYTPGCIPHDLLYERHGNVTMWVTDERTGVRTPLATKWSRLASDELMLAGIRSGGTCEFKAWAMFRAVRIGGGGTWKRAGQKFQQNKKWRVSELNDSDGVG
jgi:hypothetical protein